MSRNIAHRIEHIGVANTAALNLLGDHRSALVFVFMRARPSAFFLADCPLRAGHRARRCSGPLFRGWALVRVLLSCDGGRNDEEQRCAGWR
jgi:hypothetical protein